MDRRRASQREPDSLAQECGHCSSSESLILLERMQHCCTIQQECFTDRAFLKGFSNGVNITSVKDDFLMIFLILLKNITEARSMLFLYKL